MKLKPVRECGLHSLIRLLIGIDQRNRLQLSPRRNVHKQFFLSSGRFSQTIGKCAISSRIRVLLMRIRPVALLMAFRATIAKKGVTFRKTQLRHELCQKEHGNRNS